MGASQLLELRWVHEASLAARNETNISSKEKEHD